MITALDEKGFSRRSKYEFGNGGQFRSDRVLSQWRDCQTVAELGAGTYQDVQLASIQVDPYLPFRLVYLTWLFWNWTVIEALCRLEGLLKNEVVYSRDLIWRENPAAQTVRWAVMPATPGSEPPADSIQILTRAEAPGPTLSAIVSPFRLHLTCDTLRFVGQSITGTAGGASTTSIPFLACHSTNYTE